MAAVAVLGVMLVQRIEVAGPPTLRAAAHAISIGLAFAIAFVVYAASAHARVPWTVLVVLCSTAIAALILLRDARASRRSALGFAGATAVVVTELALVLSSGAFPAWVCAAFLVLALYAASGVSHAVLDDAPRHVYVELGIVTLVGLMAISVGAIRA